MVLEIYWFMLMFGHLKISDKKQRAFFEACKDEDSFKPDPDKNNKSFFDKVKEMFQ